MWKKYLFRFNLHLNKKCHVQNYSYLLLTVTVYGTIQSVQAVLKHCNYPDSLGTAVSINSTGERLSAVGMWTVLAKTKELTENLRLQLRLLTSKEKAIRPYLNVFKFKWQQCKVLLKNKRCSAQWKIQEDVVENLK